MMQVNTEPVLHAASRSVAQRASLLVYAAHCVLEGCPPASPVRGFAPYRPVPLDKAELRRLEAWERAELEEQGTMQTTGVEAACRFAGKLSRNLDGHYACLKLMMSFSDCALHPMDLHPRYGDIGFVQSRSTMNHLIWARAVVSAYGVIEELGLDVRTGGKPSVQDGQWNPDVLADLERRLQRNGVNLAECIPWSVRGAPRKLEKLASERFLSREKAGWARGPYVRDISVRIVDAINATSRLRSTVAAHKARALRSRLSAVDVHNVQMVARRLLMESFGEWRRYLDEDKPRARAGGAPSRRPRG